MHPEKSAAASGSGRRRIALATVAVACCGALARAGDLPQPPRAAASETQPSPAAGTAPAEDSLFRHSSTSRLWLSGQVNEIYQEHEPFPAAYTGANSLLPIEEHALSSLWTLYAGYELSRTLEGLVHLEWAGGSGLSSVLGLAGFSDLDVVRNPSLGAAPYLARCQLNKVIPLGEGWAPNDRGPLSAFREIPERRLELRVGKFSAVDFFDLNAVGSDSHLQFMNWAADNDGAYDYMADTRGYTVGAVAEYHDRWWSLRGAVGLMPTVANGIHLDGRVGRDRGQNLELELRRPLIKGRATSIRVLAYRNLARMGVYRDAMRLAAATGATPDVAATGRPGRSKTGLGLSMDQELNGWVRIFARAGWNDGRTESFAYTEIDRTLAFGGDTRVPGRGHDRLGVALVANGLSPDHRDYLAAGGLGFIIGDGALRYGSERILESYYTLRLHGGVHAAFDLQWIGNPAFNRDRGPVLIRSLRLHLDF